jgi:hypothetical protein
VKLTFELLIAPEYVTLWNELVTDDEIASSTYFLVTSVKSSKFVLSTFSSSRYSQTSAVIAMQV